MINDIPRPRDEMFELEYPLDFAPAPELNEFIGATILDDGNPLFNLDHIHLTQADIGFLWTTKPNRKQMKQIAGEAEMPNFKGGPWQKARQEQQLIQWFGYLPDFIITLDANYCRDIPEASLLALLEHEMYHCGQRSDEFGLPKFRQSDGKPVFGMRGHDIEEFIGVVRRYGIQATGQDRVDFVDAAMQEPEIAPAVIKAMCGSCSV